MIRNQEIIHDDHHRTMVKKILSAILFYRRNRIVVGMGSVFGDGRIVGGEDGSLWMGFILRFMDGNGFAGTPPAGI
jgi:hypothetical protein